MGIAEVVKLRLKMFKIVPTKDDEDILEYLINKSLNSINNITNQDYTADTFPTPIFEIWVDKAAGEYINLKKTTGELPENYDLSLLATQIKLGDTSVNLGENTGNGDEQRLNAVINFLMFGRDGELIRFRRMSR
jgi:hypothetical protein|nr:MAG TPA: tail connector protein [Caudoviricetes sp.]